MLMNTLVVKSAARAAMMCHRGQQRRYTGEPYVTHCAEVAALVQAQGLDDDVIAAAWLHDVIEDCGITREFLADMFNERVALLVAEVSDVSKPSDGSRAIRKAIDREHYAKASPEGKVIKVADLISNTRSIVAHDHDFAKVYLAEKALLLPMLADCASDTLWNVAFDQLREAQRQIDALFKLRRVHPEQRKAWSEHYRPELVGAR